MKTKNLKCLLFLGLLFVISCSYTAQEKTIGKFSKEKPYAIEIAKERSFYQAEKLTNRLIEMGIDAYLVQSADSIEDDGKWYYILCENIVNLDSANKIKKHIEEKLQLEELKIATFDNFKNAVFELDSLKLNEDKQIASNRPGVNEHIFEVINKFPESNSLLIKKTFVLNTPSDPENMEGFTLMESLRMDLPRGINIRLMLKNTTAFSEVIYMDNLYNDEVTIDIGKLRNVVPQVNHVSLISIDNNKKSYEIAELYADLILETGEYLFEEKKEIEVKSYTKLYGYKVTIEPEKGYYRTYLVLVDESNQYVIFSQSTDKTEEELVAILTNIGKGNGLLNYDEFYNTFYTIPENIVDNDLFIGFTMDKLGRSYAEIRNNIKWAREMVGYWRASGYFYNNKKGVWKYSIDDLLTLEKQEFIETLYSEAVDGKENIERIYIKGVYGHVLYTKKINRNTWTTYKKVSEVNFGIYRFGGIISNTEDSWFSKEELIERAESIQFEKDEDDLSQK